MDADHLSNAVVTDHTLNKSLNAHCHFIGHEKATISWPID